MFSFVIMGGIGFMSLLNDHNSDYLNDPIYQDFNETFNQYETTQEKVGELSEAFDTEPEWGIFGAINAMAQVAWNTMILLPTTFSFMNGAINGLHSVLGFPAWVSGTIISIIVVVILFALYSAVFGRKT